MNLGAKYKLFFSSDIMLGVKAVITIEAVGHILDPKMNLADVSAPLMTEMFMRKFSPAEMVKRLETKSPMGRMGKPAEIKGAALLLASKAGSYINGHNLVIDGGFTAI